MSKVKTYSITQNTAFMQHAGCLRFCSTINYNFHIQLVHKLQVSQVVKKKGKMFNNSPFEGFPLILNLPWQHPKVPREIFILVVYHMPICAVGFNTLKKEESVM